MYPKLGAQTGDIVPPNNGYTQNFSSSLALAGFCTPNFKYATRPLQQYTYSTSSQHATHVCLFNWELIKQNIDLTYINSYKTYSTQQSKEWCRCQASKSNFCLLWPWLLTSWPPKLIISCPRPADHLCQFALKLVIHFQNAMFTSLVMYKWTDEQTCRKHYSSDWLCLV